MGNISCSINLGIMKPTFIDHNALLKLSLLQACNNTDPITPKTLNKLHDKLKDLDTPFPTCTLTTQTGDLVEISRDNTTPTYTFRSILQTNSVDNLTARLVRLGITSIDFDIPSPPPSPPVMLSRPTSPIPKSSISSCEIA